MKTRLILGRDFRFWVLCLGSVTAFSGCGSDAVQTLRDDGVEVSEGEDLPVTDDDGNILRLEVPGILVTHLEDEETISYNIPDPPEGIRPPGTVIFGPESRRITGVSACPPEKRDEPNLTPPASVISLLEWGLNIPFNSTGNDGIANRSGWIEQPDLARYLLPWYFETNDCDSGVIFRAHTNGATTGGSGYPRSELREMTADGSDQAEWTSAQGRHTMRIVQSVNSLPAVKSHLVAGQIHNDDDDITVIRLEGSKLYMTDGNEKLNPPLTESYELGTPFEVLYVVEDNVTSLFYRLRPDIGTDDPAPDPIDPDDDTPDKILEGAYGGAYFKAGCYVQSACDGDKKALGEACNAYGEVEIFELEVTHE